MRPSVFRILSNTGNPSFGNVVWSPTKSVWLNGCLIAFLLGIPFATTPGSIILFLTTTYLSLLIGHSIGMHRKLIHRTFDCPKWFERTLVYIGVLVGMSGPSGIVKIHDTRDWAQREPTCHDFFAHRKTLIKDALWQLNCKFEFIEPPILELEREIHEDVWYQFLDRTWMLHQVPLGIFFYWLGGWAWVVWGIFGRVFVSVAGHWIVTYLTHNPGPGKWLVPNAGVQASNLTRMGLLTMGECWHNNHHAFPESARIGLDPEEYDPGWDLLRLFEKLGLVSNLGLPRSVEEREDLQPAT